jgi:hypothetical protein
MAVSREFLKCICVAISWSFMHGLTTKLWCSGSLDGLNLAAPKALSHINIMVRSASSLFGQDRVTCWLLVKRPRLLLFTFGLPN